MLSKNKTGSLIVLILTLQLMVGPIAGATSRRTSESRTKAASSRLKAKTATQAGETITIYGPRRFDRVAGPPTSVVEHFSTPSDAVAPFTVLVQNGAPDGSGRVSSATIKLNDVDLFIQRDFNQNVASLTKSVSLVASNTLDVRLASAPGSFLTITFITLRASLESLEPSRAVQGQTLNVTLSGFNTHWVSGQTRASLGSEISVGGAAAGEPGPVQVIDSTRAVAQVTVSQTAALAPRSAAVETTINGTVLKETVTLADGFVVGAITPPGSSVTNVTTMAGTPGVAGFNDGAASQARFKDLAGIAAGADDSIYVADAGNNRLRVVRNQPDSTGNPTFTVATLAGDGTAGFSDGPALSARFNNPQGVAVDASGILYIADTSNNRIRRIAVDGTVSTLAGDGTAGFQDGTGTQARFNAPRGIAVDNQGNIFVADTGNSAVRSITPSGIVATVAGDGSIGSSDSPNARFDGLSGVAVDGATLYIYLADAGNHRIRRLTPGGAVITLAGAGRGFADGAATQARFAEPAGIALDAAGKIIVADSTNSLVRFVDPGIIASSGPQAVTTLAGTGERGITDGAGNTARFFTPRGIAVSASSAIVVADSGNHVLRRILLAPTIISLLPERGRAGSFVTINGERFDGRSPSRNIVRFTRAAQAGGGQTVAQVTSASRTQLTVVVPQDASPGPVSVQTEGGTATSAASFEVINNAPVITDFNPKSGEAGSLVTLAGASLKADNGPTAVSFAGSGGARLPALVTFVSVTEVRAIVPNGAVTGIIELTNALGRAATTTAFTVAPGQNDYQLTVAPSSTTAVQRANATYIVYLTSPLNTFSQLVSLTATGLPAGVAAMFNPSQITAGASSTLSVSLAGVDLAAGSYPFSIRGSGLVNGSDLVRTAQATLNVIASGQTSLSGRVLSTESEPVMGATVSLDGRTATTDGAGAFLLSAVTAGANRPVMVDGRTASAPNRTYPVILEPATVVAGQANAVPYTFYLPAIDTQYEVDVVPGQNTVAANPRVPGLKMTIPAGANLRNRDGSAVPRVSITPLEIDRTPAPLPSHVATNLVYTSQPGGALTDLAIPVVYPNLAGADPGTRIELYAFDHDTVEWYVYGYGRVSNDGRTIAPEIDPVTGRSYGLRDFSWHFPNAAPDGNPGDSDSCPRNRGNDTVDYSSGVKIETVTDILFGGARGGLELTRIYTSDLAQTCDSCAFGRGWTHNYAIKLTGSFQAGGAGRVVFPEQVTGRLFSYARTDPDGALVFTTTATTGQLGDVVRRSTNGSLEYRYANGHLMRFDSSGRLISLVDRNGNTTTLSYSGSSLTRITDAVGRSITLEYDSSNRITRAIDPISRTWQYTYEGTPGVPGVPGLTTVTDPLNKVMKYSYVSGGRLASVTDRRNIVVKQITYDAGGRVREQRFADGGIETYSYTFSGTNVTSAIVTDPEGRTRQMRLNPSGYIIAETDPLGQKSQIDRDLISNLPRSITGPCGCAEVQIEFDERGNAVSVTDRLGQTDRYDYEPVFNNITKRTDKLGRITFLGYDERGNLTSITRAGNSGNLTTTFSYDPFGQLISINDPLNHSTSFEYDPLGNPKVKTDALNHRTLFEYDAVGRMTAYIDPLGRRTDFAYNSLYLIDAIDAARATTHFDYDESGNEIALTDMLQRRYSTVYDAKNRRTSIIDPNGRVYRYEYNKKDELTKVKTPSGRATQYERDTRGQLTALIDPLMGMIRFVYDNRRNLISLIDQRGNTTTFSYDELYRVTGVRDPVGRSSELAYDGVGNLTGIVDRQARHTALVYDEMDRLSRIIYPEAGVSFIYDDASRLTRVDDTQSGSISRTYDSSDRLLSETSANGVVSYSYNEANQRASMTAADRPPVSYDYDSAGRLRRIAQGPEVFTYTYDILSRRTALQRPNGVVTTYSYDEIDRLTRLSHTKAGSQPIEDYRYSYAADGEIASISSLASAQLIPMARTLSQADAANRIAQMGTSSFSFDNQGQTITKTDAQGTSRYEWDSRGRMTRAVLPGGQAVGYGYDALGRLASRTAGGLTTSFLYDGVEIAQDRSGTSVVDYLSGPGIDEKLRQANASGTRFFLQDHLGSTAALVDSFGDVTERIGYDPFGNTDGSAISRYGYTGRERDALTGLMYYRARWYDPQQGRFIHEDPIGIAGGVNLYSYVSNNPVSKIDPLGLYEIDVHYYLTYYLAKMNGCFTDGEIKEIAEGDQGADEDPRTSPGAFRAHENRTYHALHEGSHQPYLDKLWQEATHGHTPGQNIRQFGVYLHYLQDTFSHRGYTNPDIGHFTGRHSVDKTDSDVGKAMDMARSTWSALNDYAKQEKCGCQGQDNSTMWATVNRFASAYGGGVIGRNLSTMDEMPELLERKRRILGVPRR